MYRLNDDCVRVDVTCEIVIVLCILYIVTNVRPFKSNEIMIWREMQIDLMLNCLRCVDCVVDAVVFFCSRCGHSVVELSFVFFLEINLF